MYLRKSNMQKTFFKLVFVGAFKVNNEDNRILIRIHQSEAWIRGSGSTPHRNTDSYFVWAGGKCGVPHPAVAEPLV
jgi:hypothetical protein